ncbi:MAG: glycosyltransferase, partial [Clostridia bacterium]|nr:glycosyltransferase [Clostridia bacterium]
WDRYVVEYDGCINLTKDAIVCCDKLTTVSPGYAKEIQTEFYSSGLYHIIRMYKDKICGIINGIDIDLYNPEKDPLITENFTADSIGKKAVNKAALQKSFKLPVRADVPLIGMVSRLASHKGFDLVRRVADDILAADVQLVLLGTGEVELEDYFADLAKRYPDKCGVMLAFDKVLAKQIYASADIFLMPSKSEPCGLAQMIASRYGTVPLVRETGGLADTIAPFNPETGEGNGITFNTYNAHDMLNAIHRATALYEDADKWAALVQNAMAMDFSWEASARKYLEMYESLG